MCVVTVTSCPTKCFSVCWGVDEEVASTLKIHNLLDNVVEFKDGRHLAFTPTPTFCVE